MAEARVRIELGFDGGQTLRAEVTEADAERLERHLQAQGDGVVELDQEGGRLTIVVGRVTYLKRFMKESQIGFAGQ